MARCLSVSRVKLHAEYVEKVERIWNKGLKKAKNQWKIGFIAPLRQISSSWDKALRVKCQLRIAKTCRNCGAKPEDNSKLQACACRLVSYCSVACQKQDWKAQHKKECSTIHANQQRRKEEFKTMESLVVPIDSEDPDSARPGHDILEMLDGKFVKYGRVPGNLHGDSVFVVKLSICLERDSSCTHIAIYDEPRELLFKIHPSLPEFEKLLALIAEKGVPGSYSSKLYAFAKRDTTTSLRIFLDKVPPQVQPF